MFMCSTQVFLIDFALDNKYKLLFDIYLAVPIESENCLDMREACFRGSFRVSIPKTSFNKVHSSHYCILAYQLKKHSQRCNSLMIVTFCRVVLERSCPKFVFGTEILIIQVD